MFSCSSDPVCRQQADWIKPILFLAPEATGSQGRPQKRINERWLQDAVSHKRRIPMKKVADLLGIHRNTLHYKLKQLNLFQRFTEISDQELDIIISYYKTLRPESGIRYTQGFLLQHWIKLP